MNKDEIQKVVHTLPISAGLFCIFVKLNQNIGIKIYPTKYSRDDVYKRQKKAAKLDLGPITYGIVDIEYRGQKAYCYLTEIVETCTPSMYNLLHVKYLREELLDKINFNFLDNHYKNCGIKNEKLICIDFGENDSDYILIDEKFGVYRDMTNEYLEDNIKYV